MDDFKLKCSLFFIIESLLVMIACSLVLGPHGILPMTNVPNLIMFVVGVALLVYGILGIRNRKIGTTQNHLYITVVTGSDAVIWGVLYIMIGCLLSGLQLLSF